MAFCMNCGKQLPDGTAFCTACGTKVEAPEAAENTVTLGAEENTAAPENTVAPEAEANTEAPEVAENMGAPEMENQVQMEQTAANGNEAENLFKNQIPDGTQEPFQNQFQYQQNMYQQVPPKKKSHVGLIIGIVCGVAALLVIAAVALFLVWNKKEKVDLNDYITVEFSGYDGNGYADVVFDYTTFESDVDAILEKKHVKNNDSWLSDVYYVENAFSCSATPTSGLSNGDKVTISYTLQNESIKDYKVELVGEEKTFEVKDLQEVQEIDPFEDVSVTFTGIDGDISAEIVNNSTNTFVNDYLYFSLDKYYDISVGDEVTLSIDMTNEQAANYGYAFTQTEKKFTCSEGDSYAAALADIDEEMLGQMQSDALAYIQSVFEPDDTCTIGDWNYEGVYFLYNTDPDSWYEKNVLYVVYSSTITSTDGEYEPQTILAPVAITDIVKKSDGSVTYAEPSYIEGNPGYIGDSWTYVGSGFFDGAQMYEELITNRASEYNYEVSEGLQQYGN